VCRKRGERAKNASETLPNAPDRPETPGEAVESALVVTVRRSLVEVDRLDTVAGQVALELAVRLASRREMGSAVASLAKQFDFAMDKALMNVTVEADPLDEIRARRDAKRNSG